MHERHSVWPRQKETTHDEEKRRERREGGQGRVARRSTYLPDGAVGSFGANSCTSEVMWSATSAFLLGAGEGLLQQLAWARVDVARRPPPCRESVGSRMGQGSEAVSAQGELTQEGACQRARAGVAAAEAPPAKLSPPSSGALAPTQSSVAKTQSCKLELQTWPRSRPVREAKQFSHPPGGPLRRGGV
eukprot:1838024-Prymnesium_polylepis.1